MKKFFAILLAFVCAFSLLTGCTAVDEFVEGFKEGFNEGMQDDTVAGENDNDISVVLPTETPSDKTDDIIEPEDGEKKFEFGVVSGKTYTSEFTGVSYFLPDGWEFYSEEEIKELNNIALDTLDEDIASKIENATIIYDMYAINSNTGENVNINLEKLPFYMTSSIDVETILKSQFDMLEQSLESLGGTVDEIKYTNVEVDGKVLDAIYAETSINGGKMYQNILAFPEGDYLVYITVTSSHADNLAEILSYVTLE